MSKSKARQIKVRIPDNAGYEILQKRLAESAKKNRRSINAEILHRLENSFFLPKLEAMIRKAVRRDGAVGRCYRRNSEEVQ